MATQTEIIARSFSRSASSYDEHAAFQRTLVRTMRKNLPEENTDSTFILDVGCGSGLLTEILVADRHGASIDAIDPAPLMIERARERVPSPSVRWHVSDLFSFMPARHYDLVVSNASLQWIVPLENAVTRLSALTRPGGFIAATVMIEATFHELRALQRELFPEKPVRFALPSALLVREAFCLTELEVVVEEVVVEQVEYRSGWDLLGAIHRSGFARGGAGRAFLARGELSTLAERYSDRHGTDGHVVATHAAALIVAKKVSR